MPPRRPLDARSASTVGRGDRRRHRARARRVRRLARRRARRAGRGCCVRSPPPSTRTSRSSPSSRSRNAGHTIGNARWEAGNVRDCLNYYAARARAAVRPADPGGRRRRRHVPRAARRRRRHRAVELPDADRRLGLRAGAGRRQHGRAQAGRAHAADRDPARRAGARGGPPRGRAHRAPRQGLGRRRAVRHPPARAQGLLHRLDRGRQADHGRLRRPGEAGDPRARRQERQHRLRRRRPRAGGGHRAVRRLRQRRPGLLRPDPDPRRAQAYDEFLGRLEPAVAALRVDRPGRRGQRDGPADLRRAARHRAGLRRRRRRSRFAGGRARRRRLLVAADRRRVADRPTSRSGARRCSARSWR